MAVELRTGESVEGRMAARLRGRYLSLRRMARVLQDHGDYDLGSGQTNPVIAEQFMHLIRDADVRLPRVVWEPFAGHVGLSHSQDFADAFSVELISFDLAPVDPRVKCADSTVCGPGKKIGGAILHPPYYGAVPMSSVKGELSAIADSAVYMERLGATLSLAIKSLVPSGYLCVVCRRYRYGGREIRLDEWFLAALAEHSGSLADVWSSAPDIVLIWEKTGCTE